MGRLSIGLLLSLIAFVFLGIFMVKSVYACEMIGHVTKELIKCGVLEKPDAEKPLTNGVFYSEGQYIPV